MIQVNFGTLTTDDINEISIRITNKLVELGYVPDITDICSETDFEIQNIIFNELLRRGSNNTTPPVPQN